MGPTFKGREEEGVKRRVWEEASRKERGGDEKEKGREARKRKRRGKGRERKQGAGRAFYKIFLCPGHRSHPWTHPHTQYAIIGRYDQSSFFLEKIKIKF